ncbi:MAG: ATP-dependent dethiobiotin synthetase BioD [Spirulinaceae cyanobacterium RM2_2_10]|nr:ATP-dependent dethiobiotin synthetase BioD [Spirulinaceae cyanobacterium RM2_2_10]
MTANSLLVTGTDTEVGKTVLTAALAAYWQRYQVAANLGLMKLVQAGTGDREFYQRHFQLAQDPATLAPLVFDTPVAPPVAAQQEGRTIDLAPVWQALQTLRQTKQFVLVEALGGLGSPVTAELTVADVARDWHLPVVLVVPVQLGAIAQTVANVALARQCQLDLRGVVLNCLRPVTAAQPADWTPPALLESLTQVPVLGCLPYLENPADLTKLAQVAANLDLERLLPTP